MNLICEIKKFQQNLVDKFNNEKLSIIERLNNLNFKKSTDTRNK